MKRRKCFTVLVNGVGRLVKTVRNATIKTTVTTERNSKIFFTPTVHMTMTVASYATVPVRKLNVAILRERLIWEQATKVRHYLVCLGTQVDELSKWTVPIGVLEMVGIHTRPMGDHIQVVGGRHGNHTSGLEIEHTHTIPFIPTIA